jgi:hypothetical protein
MADRYWVGGTGTWNGTATTNWSATSGGAAGASAPTSADNVIFDVNSNVGTGAFTVTLGASSVCLNLSFGAGAQALDGMMTLAGADTFSIHGNLTLVSTNLTTTATGTWTFIGGATSRTITSAGKTFTTGTIQLNAAGADWTLQDALTVSTTTSGKINLISGTFNTNNFSVTCGGLESTGTNARTWNLGSSTVTLTRNFNGPINFSGTNLTFNAGTSNILIIETSSPPDFRGNGVTFYDVNFSGVSTQAIAISGANTFNNLSFSANVGVRNVVFSANQTINGALSGTTTFGQTLFFQSSVAGTQRTLSIASFTNLINTRWKDINFSGAASPWTAPPGPLDLGNNSNITFFTSPLYWVGGTGTFQDGLHWATSSGGTAVTGAFPNQTNDVYFDSLSSATAYTATISATFSIKGIYIAGPASGNVTLAGSQDIFIFGSLLFPATGLTRTYTGNISFVSTTTGNTITTNGVSLSNQINFNGIGGEWTLGSALTNSSTININDGTFNSGNQSVTCQTFGSTSGRARTINLGSSTFTVSFTSIDFIPSTNLTFNAGTSNIIHSATSGEFRTGGLTFYDFTTTGLNVGFNRTITGSATFNNYTIGKASGIGTPRIELTGGNSFTINGTFTSLVSGSGSTIRRVMLTSVGGVFTINAAAVNLVDVDFVNIAGTGLAAPFAGTRLGNVANGNSGITFDAPRTVYWNVPAGGTYTDTAWAASSGGTVALANYPLAQDTAIIEDTGLNTSATITVAANTAWMADMSTRTNAMTFSVLNSTSLIGVFKLSTAVTFAGGTSQINVYSNALVVTAGKTIERSFSVFNGMVLGDTFTSSTQQQLLGGTLDLNGFDLTATIFFTNVSTLRSIAFGTNKIILTGTGTVYNGASSGFSYTGTCNFFVSSTGSTAITLNPGTVLPTVNQAPCFTFAAGTYTLTLGTNQYFGNLDFTNFVGTLASVSFRLNGDIKFSAGMTLATATNTISFYRSSGTQTITTNGKTIPYNLSTATDVTAGTITLADNLTILAGNGLLITHNNGGFNANGFNVTVDSFVSSSTTTRSLTMGSGTWNLTGTAGILWSISASTNMTFNSGTSTITYTSDNANNKSFSGAGLTYYNFIKGGNPALVSGILIFIGSNTFNDISITKTVANTVQFTGGTTNTFANWSISGSAGQLVTLASTTTTAFNLVKTGTGVVSANYLSISRSNASPSNTWYAGANSTNGGNNTGWIFSAPPVPAVIDGLFLQFFQ